MLYDSFYEEVGHKVYHTLLNSIKFLFGETIEYKVIYFLRTRKYWNNKKPKDLNEKSFWLVRYWRHPLIVKCADKYKVREYLYEKGCGDILNELYLVCEKGEQVEFDNLPPKFVLKCNHGSRMNIICEDKASFDKDDAIKQLNKWMNFQYGRGVEWQYKEIERKILVEKYLESADGKMIEYQIFCFNGKPTFFLVRNDLRKSKIDKENTEFAVSYTIDWKRVYMRKNEEQFDFELPKPHNYQKMIDYASRLSRDFPLVRVDYYEIDDRLVFGELTFTSHGAIQSNYKDKYIQSLGELLILPPKYND
ncbi:MAG: hypothetical protein IKI06_04725 [Prevotella sp.]|jgi:hypothetical protein|nr:hypothetical protein [Prevotella sp.]